jgi:hypothetical protein
LFLVETARTPFASLNLYPATDVESTSFYSAGGEPVVDEATRFQRHHNCTFIHSGATPLSRSFKMRFSTSVCTVALVSVASAKWDGKAPAEPTAFATQVVNAVQEAAVTQAPDASASRNFLQGADGANMYANNYYASEVLSLAIPSLANKALAAKASAVAKVPSFFWMYVLTISINSFEV